MKSHRHILLVEDDEVDAMTVKRALKEIKVGNDLEMAKNGEEALKKLSENDELPCLILLDLNMPKMNGIEFLKVAKEHDNYKKIPVVVLTTSNEERDKVASFKLGIAGYMLKPVDYRQFVETMREIDMYWTVSELPD